MVKQTIQEQQQQQEVISQELVSKFDNDEQLVKEFLDAGYAQADLSTATITHPTRYDPLVTLENGEVAGMWIDNPEEEKIWEKRNIYRNDSNTYSNRRNKFF